MLQTLNYDDILNWLYEIMDNGDMHGYVWEFENRDGYYEEYKDQFDELSAGANGLWEAMQDSDVRDNWNDMTVALLGETHTVLGFDSVQVDYYSIDSWEEQRAIWEAAKRIGRLTKYDMIRSFRKVMTTLVFFFDIKAAHDCLTSIVEELDDRAAMMKRNQGTVPQRSWAE
jgi:hypothetical protein